MTTTTATTTTTAIAAVAARKVFGILVSRGLSARAAAAALGRIGVEDMAPPATVASLLGRPRDSARRGEGRALSPDESRVQEAVNSLLDTIDHLRPGEIVEIEGHGVVPI